MCQRPEKNHTEIILKFRIPSRVVYNGVVPQTEYRKPKKGAVEKNHIFKIVFIGRLEEIKGVHLLIEATDELRKKYPVQLEVVGYGGEQENLQMMSEELGLEKSYILRACSVI